MPFHSRWEFAAFILKLALGAFVWWPIFQPMAILIAFTAPVWLFLGLLELFGRARAHRGRRPQNGRRRIHIDVRRPRK